jgi:tagatose 6-phosphate kinase
MILCIGTTPAAQRVMVFRKLVLDAVNRAVTTLDGAAGKSVNVAKVLQALGEKPVATGFLAGDRGESLRTMLDSRGIAHDFVRVASPTRQCTTVIDESAGQTTELVEESRPARSSDYERLAAAIRRRSKEAAAVIMSGTLTPGGPVDFYRRCTQLAHEVGALAVVDAHGAPLFEALKANPDLVKPNRSELATTVGLSPNDEAAVLSAMRELHERGARRVVVTAGKGPALASDGQSLWRVQPPPIAAVNPIGSGDAFAAGLVWRLVQGDAFGEACRWAAAVGAANALTLMPGEVERDQVERLVREVQVERL